MEKEDLQKILELLSFGKFSLGAKEMQEFLKLYKKIQDQLAEPEKPVEVNE